jgi:hypothetical protein
MDVWMGGGQSCFKGLPAQSKNVRLPSCFNIRPFVNLTRNQMVAVIENTIKTRSFQQKNNFSFLIDVCFIRDRSN